MEFVTHKKGNILVLTKAAELLVASGVDAVKTDHLWLVFSYSFTITVLWAKNIVSYRNPKDVILLLSSEIRRTKDEEQNLVEPTTNLCGNF